MKLHANVNFLDYMFIKIRIPYKVKRRISYSNNI